MSRKIIRNGQMEFEVDSFDSSAVQVGKIVAEESGFIATTDSEKLPNGKVKGTIVLRVPPDHLDQLVLQLRGLGDLQELRIAAQDVTKEFTDSESDGARRGRWRNGCWTSSRMARARSRTWWRPRRSWASACEKIEKSEGERYMQSLISLSTLTVTLLEPRDQDAARPPFETETVAAGIETEDITKARDDANPRDRGAQGSRDRIQSQGIRTPIGSTRRSWPRFRRTPPARLIDRLKADRADVRMDNNRKQTTEGDSSVPGMKIERKPTVFSLNLYNLANISPRKTGERESARTDVKGAYEAILAAVN